MPVNKCYRCGHEFSKDIWRTICPACVEWFNWLKAQSYAK